jgi:predicted Holliday junction resolvase-like endonuclease
MDIDQIIVLILSIISIVLALISIKMRNDAMKEYKKYLEKKASPEFQRKLQEENERFIKELEAQFQAERENDGNYGDY